MKLMRSSLYARKDPYITILWLSILGSILVFFFLSVIYITISNRPDWIRFKLPFIFWVSTWVIALSSASMYLARRAFKKEKFTTYRAMIGLTFALGLTFVASQLIGWHELKNAGIVIRGNVSGAFLYIFSGLHLVHIVGGVIALFFAFKDALKHSTYVDSFIQSLNPIKRTRLKLISIYWHFVDILWIYMFIFFLVQQ